MRSVAYIVAGCFNVQAGPSEYGVSHRNQELPRLVIHWSATTRARCGCDLRAWWTIPRGMCLMEMLRPFEKSVREPLPVQMVLFLEMSIYFRHLCRLLCQSTFDTVGEPLDSSPLVLVQHQSSTPLVSACSRRRRRTSMQLSRQWLL